MSMWTRRVIGEKVLFFETMPCLSHVPNPEQTGMFFLQGAFDFRRMNAELLDIVANRSLIGRSG
jgi:hypothetical protein